jgi:hypothetical protein
VSSYKINSNAIKDPVKFDPSIHTCIGMSVGFHEMYCPNYQVVTMGGDYPSGRWELVKPWTKEEWLSRLDEKINFIILKTPLVSGSDPERKHIALITGFLDPDSGLEMVEKVAISSPSPSGYYLNTWPNPAN